MTPRLSLNAVPVHLSCCGPVQFVSLCVSDHLARLGAEYVSALEYRVLVTISGEEWIEVVSRTSVNITSAKQGNIARHFSIAQLTVSSTLHNKDSARALASQELLDVILRVHKQVLLNSKVICYNTR